jgi:hypothetical protein
MGTLPTGSSFPPRRSRRPCRRVRTATPTRGCSSAPEPTRSGPASRRPARRPACRFGRLTTCAIAVSRSCTFAARRGADRRVRRSAGPLSHCGHLHERPRRREGARLRGAACGLAGRPFSAARGGRPRAPSVFSGTGDRMYRRIHRAEEGADLQGASSPPRAIASVHAGWGATHALHVASRGARSFAQPLETA